MADNPDLNGGDNAHRVAADQLRAFCERIERLEEEKKAAADDIKEVFLEAKSVGYNPKALKEVLKERALDRDKVSEHRAVVNLYANALGMHDIFA